MSRIQAVILSGILSAATASTVAAQSLAEAAQKEAARRKEVKGTARLITNKDLPDVPRATAAAPAQAATPAPDSSSAKPAAVAPTDDQPSKADGNGERDEKYWRDRLAQAKEDVVRNQIYVDALQTKINALTTDFVNRDDPAQRGLIADDRDRSIAELNRLKKAVVDGTKAIGAIEDEARRAGVPPGWLR
jgi:hypothetical protein